MGTMNDIRRVFPAAAPVLRITTDGDDLIIHNVETEDGKLYNLRVRRLDASKNIINVTEDDPFSVALIHKVMLLGKELLKPSVLGNFKGLRMWVSTDGDRLKYSQEKIDEDEDASPSKKPEVLADLPRDKLGDLAKKGGPAAVWMAHIYQAFFETRYTGDGAKGQIRPTFVPKAPKPIKPKYKEEVVSEDSPDSSKAAPSKAKKEKKLAQKKEVPKDMVQHLPTAIRDKELGQPSSANPSASAPTVAAAAGSPPAGPVPSGREHIDGLIQAIDNPAPVALSEMDFRKPTSLAGLNYKMLHDYSLTKRRQPSDPADIALNYESFKRLLEKAHNVEQDVFQWLRDCEKDEQDMFQWLRHCFYKAHKFHEDREDEFFDALYQTDLNRPDNYNDWCVECAARAVALFIRADGISAEALINKIIETSTRLT